MSKRTVLQRPSISSVYFKLLTPQPFLGFVEQLGISDALFTLFLISSIEAILGLMLLIGINLKFVYRFISALFLFFAVIHIYSIKVGITVACGCFGDIYLNKVGWLSVLSNFLLCIISFIASKYPHILALDQYFDAKSK
ncbi:MAG: MauE/DoxX family redox-associated membrane protein [Balneolaceae bacterium]